MGQRIDVKHLNIYYGDFLAVEDVNLNIEPNKVTAFIGPSGCGKSTVLRTLDRMHEIIPGAHVKGEVLLEGRNLYAKDVDPVEVRRDVGMVFQRPKNEYTIVIVTHNMQQAARIADYTGFFNLKAVGQPGHLEYFTDTSTMFNNPQNEEAERYVSGRFG